MLHCELASASTDSVIGPPKQSPQYDGAQFRIFVGRGARALGERHI